MDGRSDGEAGQRPSAEGPSRERSVGVPSGELSAEDLERELSAVIPEREPACGDARDVESPLSAESTSFAVQVLGMRRGITVSGTRDQRIAAVANLQRGRLSRQQLLAIGIGSNTIYRLSRSGYLSPKHRCVYALHRVDVEYGDETAALLALRGGSVLSHQSAASVWGLAPADRFIHATVAGAGAGATLEGVRVHRAANLSEAESRLCEGLPVTSLLQTLCDCAPVLSVRALELAVDHAIVDHYLDTELLRRRCAGRPGSPRIVAILNSWDGPTITHSEAEELFLRLIRQAELPPPRINIFNGGKERDYRWPAQRVLVEIDSYQFHGSHRAFESDRRRDARASAIGFTTIRITYRQLIKEPMAVIARLAAALVHGENRS
jgi:very-short-patch-repair endonuclease